MSAPRAARGGARGWIAAFGGCVAWWVSGCAFGTIGSTPVQDARGTQDDAPWAPDGADDDAAVQNTDSARDGIVDARDASREAAADAMDAASDTARPDASAMDAALDVARTDAVTMDVVDVVVRDAGPVTCTATTAAAVCGGRPCVDGYCCDGACTGACRGCAVPGSEGRCTNHASGSDPESECAEQAPGTCGTTGVCNGAGACALHPSGTACDDGMACSAGDQCDGLGACRGTAPVSCAPGAGNECCVGACTSPSGCATTAGACADQCGANVLRTGRMCQGCGAAGAAGTCGGGGEFACDAMNHALCQSLSCGGMTFWCTNDGGTWQWRAAARCDDGNACTHTDTCTGTTCAGTAIACTSDACATRSCNGTSACATTILAGAVCDDGNATTNVDRCSSAGVCVGSIVCALPTDACADGTQSRDRCTGARIIGRRTAGSTAGFTTTGSLCSASNRFDDCNWDAGRDHAYRIWMRTGEVVSASVTKGTGCVNASWDVTLKLYQGTDCGSVTCSGDRWCRARLGTGAQTYTAPREGWVVIVVDGSTAFDDWGDYTLRVRLSGCAAASCECP